MQCPISVQGKECGAEARTQLRWPMPTQGVIALHFSCLHGHRFHIDPHERWQVCRCPAETPAVGSLGILSRDADTLLRTLAARKGVRVIVDEGPVH